jgi:hypothetical protein
VQPFLVRANLVFRVNGDDVLFISSVRMLFTDTSGIAAPQVTLPGPIPIHPFGTALDQARSPQFPLDFRFGCGVGRHGTLVVIANTRDQHGREFTNRLQATVR